MLIVDFNVENICIGQTDRQTDRHKQTDRQTDRQTRTNRQTDRQTDNRDAARLRSIRGKGAGAWLDSIPSSEKFALSSGNFVLAASLRLGLLLSLPPWATKCECGKSLDVEGYHLLTCKMGGGPVWSHNSVVLC